MEKSPKNFLKLVKVILVEWPLDLMLFISFIFNLMLKIGFISLSFVNYKLENNRVMISNFILKRIILIVQQSQTYIFIKWTHFLKVKQICQIHFKLVTVFFQFDNWYNNILKRISIFVNNYKVDLSVLTSVLTLIGLKFLATLVTYR